MATTAGRPRLYRLDFAGRHNIATGMLNTALTAVTVAVVAHVATATGAATALQTTLAIAATTIIGVMMTLVWGAFSNHAPQGPTILHRITCWIGAGVWAAMLAAQDWYTTNLFGYGLALSIATAVIGFVGWLQTPAASPQAAQLDANREEERRQQRIRDDLGAEWEDRILRVCRLQVQVVAISDYPHKTMDGRRIGYTIEVHLPAGGCSWRTIAQSKAQLEGDANLEPGCDVVTRMGRTRRVALIDVTVINVLDQEHPYPTDYSPLSVHEEIPTMVSRNGTIRGPKMRSSNTGIFGESGSGKTNTGQVLGAGIARMVDAHLCDIDITGIRMSMPLIRPYLEGRAKVPAVFWVAWNEREAIFLLRALDRVARARNNGYNDLKLAIGDDKMPISAEFPAFLLRCDEVKYLVGMSAEPMLYQLIRKITDDHRDAGLRALFLALRGTNDIILQAVQEQLHNLGALRAQSKSAYTNIFSGQAVGLEPEDAPYPGCIQMRLESSGQIQPYHVYRLVGKQLDDIAVAVADYQPGVDALSWNALNGRDRDGTPMPDLMPGELDCCATRWTRFKAAHGYEVTGDNSSNAAPTSAGIAGMTTTVAQATANVDDALKRAEDAIRRRQEQGDRDAENRARIEREIADMDINKTLSDIFGCDMSLDASEPRTLRLPGNPSTAQPPVDNWSVVAEIIEQSGIGGIEMSAIHSTLAERGVKVDRATVHKWLKSMTMDGGGYGHRIEWRPDREGGRNGRWYPISGNGPNRQK